MNKLSLLIIFIANGFCKGQNLVPNPSFEDTVSCPANFSDFEAVLDWINPAHALGTGGTPDYYNECSNPSNVGVPINRLGYQQPHSGAAYAGIALYAGDDWREYIEAQLTFPLAPNSCYHFEMFVNLPNNCSWTTDNFGIYFSDSLVFGINNYYPLPFTPQINNTEGFIIDTLNWILISGNYIAQGGENYLIIGNFNDNSHTDTLYINHPILNIPYIYIDDVSLTLCTGIAEQSANEHIKIFPNPFSGILNVDLNEISQSEIFLYDITSRKLLQQKFTSSVSLNTGQLASGIYIYEVRTKNGVLKKGKVVKE
jgi:OmpA-OmpF porin, OOP family